jgi:hypothetical protein
VRLILDTGTIDGLGDEIRERLRAATKRAAATLAPAMHAHALELASERLHSRREMFVDNLHFIEEQNDTYVISLDAKARWIDDGMEAHDMKADLLKSPKAKTAKDGSKYLVVPFNHGPGKGATTMSPAQLTLQDTIKRELKNRKIPYAKIEKDGHGRPKTGLLHSFDIGDKPLKTAEGPGQGKGPVGKVMQGPTGIPLLQGIRVYQRATEGGKVKRAIMTFRIVSSKHGADRWQHPGVKAARILDDTYEWGKREWEHNILPTLLDEVLGHDLIARRGKT